MASSFRQEFPVLRPRAAGCLQSRHHFCRSPFARSSRCEQLEDRRLLALLTVTTDQDVVDFNDGQTSLREAIFAANIVPGADEIVFNFGQPGPTTILLDEGELQITEALTITGPGAELLTIDANGIANVSSSSVFNINDGKVATVIDVFIESLTLTGAQNSAIRSKENLTLTSITLSGNKSIAGGALWMEPAFNSAVISLSIIDSTLVNNISTGSVGGAIYFWGTSDKISIQDTVFSENKVESIEFGRGGAIYIEGLRNHVEIIDTRIENNSARNGGGVYVSSFDGDIRIIGSDISHNTAWYRGGGIYAQDGNLHIERTVITENVAKNGSLSASGGGIRFSSAGEVVIHQSTISGNSANSSGGGIAVDRGILSVIQSTFSDNSSKYGGGISSSVLVLNNSTITGNSAKTKGGGIYSSGPATIINSTITSNSASYSGGGISARGFLLVGSVVANNSAPSRPDVSHGPLISSSISAHYSLIGYVTTPFLTEAPVGSPDANGNLIGGPVHGVIDPLLGPLADNGGPTLTHALLPGSPAINAGDPSAVASEVGVPEFDQRGAFTRVFGGRIDIGAYEAQSLVVDTLIDENDGDYSPGDFSLREAIALANQIAGANTIEFDPSLAGGTILLTMGELAITDSVEVIGLGAELLTIDAQQQSRIFHMIGNRASVAVALKELTLTGGRTVGEGANFGGGAIYSAATNLTIERSIITGNSTLGSGAAGGAIFTRHYLTLKDTHVSDNYTLANSANGGAFYARVAKLIDCTIENNHTYGATARGGAAFLGSNRLSLEASGTQFIGNRTFGQGSSGGAFYTYGSATISGSRFENNSTSGMLAGGGAINSGGGGQSLSISSSILINNSTNGDGAGGGAVLARGTMEIRDSLLSGNETVGNNSGGGAIDFSSGSVLKIVGSEVSVNTVIGLNASGGGIRAEGQIMIDKSHIHNNRVVGESAEGGGLFSRGSLTISNSVFSQNRVIGAGARGGALYSVAGSRAPSTIFNTTITGNEVTGSNSRGGGIHAEVLTLRHSTVTLNRANGSGADTGGIRFFNISQPVISHTIIADNFAGINPSNLPQFNVLLNVRYSLIGVHPIEILVATSVDSVDANGNLVGTPNNPVDPLLGPLADNGGPTLTHALLPGSPAINAGDPTLLLGVNGTPEFDQRGAPFTRIAGGRIDIGAYESQPPQGTFDGDFDGDGDIDGRDFLNWQRGVGTIPADKADGDATGNQLVDGNDLAVWQETYGRELSALGSQLLANSPESSSVYRVPGSGSRLLTFGTSLLHDTAENDTADNAESKFADLVIEDFNRDQAFEYWQPQQRCDFGDIATRRATGSSVSERTLVLQR